MYLDNIKIKLGDNFNYKATSLLKMKEGKPMMNFEFNIFRTIKFSI